MSMRFPTKTGVCSDPKTPKTPVFVALFWWDFRSSDLDRGGTGTCLLGRSRRRASHGFCTMVTWGSPIVNPRVNEEMFMPADSLPSHKSTHPHPIVWGGVGWGGVGWGGVGWGGMITSLTTPHDLDATFYDLHGQFHMILMLRFMIFIGNST